MKPTEETLATATVTATPAPQPVPEPPLDFTVRVDRSFVVLPRWADPRWLTQEFMDLQATGPAEYDLHENVERWPYDGQKMGVVKCQYIYDRIKATDTHANHLGLADLLAIQAKGIGVFRKLYAGSVVFGFKSVVRRRRCRQDVPCLFGNVDRVVLGWHWLNDDFHSFDFALRFRKSA